MLKKMKWDEKSGFTLIELMITIAIIGTLAAIAIPNYINYREKATQIKVIAELKTIEKELYIYQVERNTFPDNLAQIGLDSLKDPWGNSYRYLPVEGTPKGALRKDHFLVPVNTDFDLYSMGPDGKSQAPFTAKASRDDIVRASNGQYIGPVSSY